MLRVSQRHPSVLRLALLASIVGSFLFGAVAGTPGIVGKPRASFVGSTRYPAASVGQTLAGGGVSFITQFRKCTRSAFIVSV